MQWSDLRQSTIVLALLSASFYLLLCGTLYRQILSRNGGHFVYALDDPYIHLALSENIAHGHYGINAVEPASPSSSLLWPFLLAPFARFSWQVYVPLWLNLFFGTAAAVLSGLAVAHWPLPGGPARLPSQFPAEHNEERWRLALSALALVFIANLPGLTFIGMEHTLQVLLAGVVAWGLIACLRARPIPRWCFAAAILGPAVRYENLALSLALAVALIGRRKARGAVLLFTASMVPLLLFALYLHWLGLPWLPTSVLVKSQIAGSSAGPVARAMLTLRYAVKQTFLEPRRMVVAILFLTLVCVAWHEKVRERRFALAGAALAVGLHLLIGRFHWFYRYEVYIVFFSVLPVLHVEHERARGLLGWYALGLFGCAQLYLQAFHEVPASAGDVYREQYQMHRFVTEFYDGNFAVNDLGLASYRRRPGTYVLDLWGLGSEEAARQRNKSTAWLDAVTRAHHVELVMDYALWFSPPPRTWSLLGEVCLEKLPVALGDPCVNYYATDPATAPGLQEQFDDFARTMPAGVTVRHPLLPPPPDLPGQ